jgi:hypothetical protein
MIRVCLLSLFLAVLLPGCATEQAQAPVTPPVRVNTAEQKPAPKAENEDIDDCVRKTSVVHAWNCVSGAGLSQ